LLFESYRFDDLQKKAMKIVHAFWKPSKLCNIASRKLEACYNEIDEIAQNMRYNISTEDVSVSVIANNILIEGGETNKEMSFRDPPQSQCKGKRKHERFKHPVEKKMRTCTICHAKAGHNARTCPQVQISLLIIYVLINLFVETLKFFYLH
jgi:hypothetical protein